MPKKAIEYLCYLCGSAWVGVRYQSEPIDSIEFTCSQCPANWQVPITLQHRKTIYKKTKYKSIFGGKM